MVRLTREQSRQRTRERLLAAAADLFTERGVTGTSVEQVAERAGPQPRLQAPVRG